MRGDGCGIPPRASAALVATPRWEGGAPLKIASRFSVDIAETDGFGSSDGASNGQDARASLNV